MRVALQPLWPALYKHFGVRPFDLERLTRAEVRQYLETLEDMAWAKRP